MTSKQSIFDTYPILKTIPMEKFPKHILIIPDGNGRWAQQENKFVLYGHKKAAEEIRKILHDLSELKEVEMVTLWGFSADNWKRSEKEVKGLLKLMQYQIADNLVELKERHNRFVHLGRKDRLPQDLLATIEKAEKETEHNTGQILCVAIDFGGEDQALRIIEQSKLLPKDMPVTKELLWKLRDGKGLIPQADLLIRTSGEKRTSDIGWLNGAATELYFIDKFSPDITTADIIEALVDFSKRDRRFGARK